MDESGGYMIKLTLITACCIIFLAGCVNSNSMHTDPEPVIEVPFEDVAEEIIAQGSFFISNARYSPQPPTIGFYPFLGYRHLFDFTNSNDFFVSANLDEFLELLDRDDVYVIEDRFGNLSIENATASFGNFVLRNDSVYADIVGFIKDWEGYFWEVAEVDFLTLTNWDMTMEQEKIRVGESYLGFTLQRIDHSTAFLRNGEFYGQILGASELSGQVELKGNLSIGLRFDSDYRIFINFDVKDEYLSLLPRIAVFCDDSDEFWDEFSSFSIINVDALIDTLGITDEDLEINRVFEVEGVMATFELSWLSSFGVSAYFIELK